MIFLGEILCHNHSAKEVEIAPAEFEWTATMLNINSNRNRELMERCKYLQDYSTYVRLVEENKRKYAYMREAVTAAVDEAIRLDLLGGYFRKCREEAILDVLTEFDEVAYKKSYMKTLSPTE